MERIRVRHARSSSVEVQRGTCSTSAKQEEIYAPHPRIVLSPVPSVVIRNA